MAEPQYANKDKKETVDTNVQAGNKDYTDLLDKAVAASEKQNVVRSFLRDTFGDNIANKLEPLVGSLTAAAEEVGLSEEDLPLFTFLNIYTQKNTETLSLDEYIKVHNAYARNVVSEDNLTDKSAQHIIFNPSLYENTSSDRDFDNIVDVFNKLSTPEKANRALKNDLGNLKIGDKEYSAAAVVADPTVLRQNLLFTADGKVNRWADIYPIWKQITNPENDTADADEAYRKLVNRIKAENAVLANSDFLDLIILFAFMDVYEDLSDRSKEQIGKAINKKYQKSSDELKQEEDVKNELDSAKAIISRSEDLVNYRNLEPVINIVINKLLNKKSENKKDSEDKDKKGDKIKDKTVILKRLNDKYDKMKEYIDNLIRITNKDKKNLYRYIMFALASYKPHTGSAIIDQATPKDVDTYNNYIKDNLPQDLGKAFSQKRLDDIMSRKVFTGAGLTKGIATALIKYLDQYKPAR